MNKTFARFAGKVEVANYLESVKGAFLSLQSYRRFPRDEEFREALESTDLYNFRRRMYFFRQFETFGRKEKVIVEQYSIEHIMPQNPQLSKTWQAELGPNWSEIQDRYLHTLGNLTLTGYNSEYSDKPFIEKRDMPEVGFAASPLRLNAGLGQISTWTLESILSRAETLAQKGLTIWPCPKLTEEALLRYRDQEMAIPDKYSLADHPWLTFSPKRVEFYDRVHNAILSIDPVIRREFLKVYVAYKAESNFVDVIPLKSKLCLSINIPLGELFDPLSIARDVSAIGRWGTGLYEVDLDEGSDFDYVLGLIRQAFEHQLDLTA
jgi:predicted transport protein